MQDERIPILNFTQNAIGRTVKSSKVEYIFEFEAVGKKQNLKFIRSYYSHKIRIYLNEQMIHNEEG